MKRIIGIIGLILCAGVAFSYEFDLKLVQNYENEEKWFKARNIEKGYMPGRIDSSLWLDNERILYASQGKESYHLYYSDISTENSIRIADPWAEKYKTIGAGRFDVIRKDLLLFVKLYIGSMKERFWTSINLENFSMKRVTDEEQEQYKDLFHYTVTKKAEFGKIYPFREEGKQLEVSEFKAFFDSYWPRDLVNLTGFDMNLTDINDAGNEALISWGDTMVFHVKIDNNSITDIIHFYNGIASSQAWFLRDGNILMLREADSAFFNPAHNCLNIVVCSPSGEEISRLRNFAVSSSAGRPAIGISPDRSTLILTGYYKSLKTVAGDNLNYLVKIKY